MFLVDVNIPRLINCRIPTSACVFVFQTSETCQNHFCQQVQVPEKTKYDAEVVCKRCRWLQWREEAEADEGCLLEIHFHYEVGNYCFILDIDHSADPEGQIVVLFKYLSTSTRRVRDQEPLCSVFLINVLFFSTMLSWKRWKAPGGVVEGRKTIWQSARFVP